MRNKIYILLAIGLLSCSESKVKETKRAELRNLIVFDFDSLLYKMNYELIIREKDSTIIYEYKNIIDSTKSKKFRYLKDFDRLQSGPSEFKKVESNRLSKILDFNLYNSDSSIMDGAGSIIFNKDYGVLGFEDGMGTQYYFINDITKYIELPILHKNEGIESSLIGRWRLKNSSAYSEIQFYENNIWKSINKNYKNETVIHKGKFSVAKDSAIFFRYFGSQHWPNKDTINDYKTSIGSFVLFLNSKNELWDNQEDYQQLYIKLE